MDKLKVLIAEDEFVIRETLKLYIEELGHQVIAEASDGAVAVEYALKHKPDLIIMDINMPQLDGIEAIKKINQDTLIPTVIISAYHEDKLIKRANDEGVLYYLLKPVDIHELKIAINISMRNFHEFQNIQEELQDTKKALEARKYIEKAKGILMDHLKISEAEAMKRLQTMSRSKNKKIIVVAKEIINAKDFFVN